MSAGLSIDQRDAHLIRQAKSQNMSQADRDDLWRRHYRGSPERQVKFLMEDSYCGFMEGCYRGLIRADENQREKPSGRDPRTERLDAAALDLAKKNACGESDRRKSWSSLWRESPERQREFPKEEHYVAWMEHKSRRTK